MKAQEKVEDRKPTNKICIKCFHVSDSELICPNCSFLLRSKEELKTFLFKKLPSMRISNNTFALWKDKVEKAIEKLNNPKKKPSKKKREYRKVFYILYIYKDKTAASSTNK